MNLNLKNPLVFFDLETTGTNITTDRIIELAYVKVFPNGKTEEKDGKTKYYRSGTKDYFGAIFKVCRFV